MGKNNTPLFSIIVPMYNVEKYAEECIVSILSQTFDDYEAILVDDGSTDGTGELIDRYLEGNTQKLIAIHKENGGLVSARQAGLEIANGKYIVPLDGDDWINPVYLETFKHAIDQVNAEVYCSGHTIAYPDGSKKERHLKLKGVMSGEQWETIVNRHLLHLNPNLWGKCIKADFYTPYQKSISPTIRMGEDGVVTFPMYAHAHCVCFLDDCSYNYRQVDTSMVHSKRKNILWSQALWRIKHLYNQLENVESRNQWMAAYATHSGFNSIISIFQGKKFHEARTETNNILDDKFYSSLISQKSFFLSKKERIANFLLRKRLYSLIWIMSRIN